MATRPLPVVHANAKLRVPIRCDGMPPKQLGARLVELSLGDVALGFHDGLVVGRSEPCLEIVGRGIVPFACEAPFQGFTAQRGERMFVGHHQARHTRHGVVARAELLAIGIAVGIARVGRR